MNAATKVRRAREEAWRKAIRENRALRIDWPNGRQTFRAYDSTEERAAAVATLQEQGAVELSDVGFSYMLIPARAGEVNS